MRMKHQALITAATEIRANAYAPYSRYAVGTALKTRAGKIYTATNVENASYGLTLCAERVALAYAVSQGERDFEAIAVVTESEPPATPCGACRQVLAEFGRAIEIVCVNLQGTVTEHTAGSLLPDGFGRESLIP
jgi:cytidine deaminase